VYAAIVCSAGLTGCSSSVFSEPEPGTAEHSTASPEEPPILKLDFPEAPAKEPVVAAKEGDGLAPGPALGDPRGELPAASPAPIETGKQKNPLREGSGSGDPLKWVSPTSQKPEAAPGAKHPAAVKSRKANKEEKKFDPIRENGEFFVGWPKPRLALVLTGCLDGYFEPCGCAGLDQMKGGLSRRCAMLDELREKGWPVVALDVGGLIKGFGKQTNLKFQTLLLAMQTMRYNAIGLGKGELKLTTGELLSYVGTTPGMPSPFPFVSANVGVFGLNENRPPATRVVKVGDLKIGVTSILGKTHQAEVSGNNEIEMIDPNTALKRVVPAFEKEPCRLLVLLAHASVEESKELAREFPQFQVVVTAGGAPEPPADRTVLAGGKQTLVEVGEKGMNAIVLGVFDDPKQPVRYQRVILDSRYSAAPEIVKLMADYQNQLREEGLEKLGVGPIPHPQAKLLGRYVGSKKCAESCHEPSYEVWRKSKHAKAFDTLLKASPPRDADPECIACHVTGWYAQGFSPYQGGFLSQEKTRHLIDVGCESCHGPGGAHCDAEMGSNEALKLKLRKAAVVTKAEAEKRLCVTCHDLDNSPHFDFATDWPLVEHKEKE
jgi:hypothetical protein